MIHVITGQFVFLLFFFLILLVGEYICVKRDMKYLRLASRTFSIGMIFMELLLMALMIMVNSQGNSYSNLLEIHFWIIFTAISALALFGLVHLMMTLINPASEELDDGDTPKWAK